MLTTDQLTTKPTPADKNKAMVLGRIHFQIIFAVVCAACSISLCSSSLRNMVLWLFSQESEHPSKSRMTAIYLDVPLTESFSLNSQQALEVRENNMKLYHYPYNKDSIDRRKTLSLQEYRDVYDGKWPVLVQDVVPTWKASNWSHKFLCDKYGQERVVMKGVNGGLHKSSMLALPLKMFCEHTNNTSWKSWTYVEDELFILMRPELHKDIGETVPGDENFFSLFPNEVRPWDSMLLWGTAYSRSSLHIDPYNWTGTNAVISGLKRWRMFPPGQDQYLYVRPNRTSGFPLNCYKYNSPIDSYEIDKAEFPEFGKAVYFEFDQHPGELLLIPSGWFHQAYNVEETIAVSSQLTNINNYRIVLEEIIKIGNVERSQIPANILKLSKAEQVKFLMSMLPQQIINRGLEITKDILAQVADTS